MNVIRIVNRASEVSLSINELVAINNALNEICHGIDLFEFETRIGAPRQEVESLLKSIGSLIQQIEGNQELV